MGRHAYDTRGPVGVLKGHVAVECRLVLTVTCPVCGVTHRQRLEVGDHPELGGDRFWSLRCHGARYLAHVPRAWFVAARTRAEAISTQHSLDLSWLARGDPPRDPSEDQLASDTRATQTAHTADPVRERRVGSVMDGRPHIPGARTATPGRRLWLVTSPGQVRQTRDARPGDSPDPPDPPNGAQDLRQTPGNTQPD